MTVKKPVSPTGWPLFLDEWPDCSGPSPACIFCGGEGTDPELAACAWCGKSAKKAPSK